MQNSPFPGMDPYLEAKWREVHARLSVYAANQLNQQLPDELQANIEENVSLRLEDETTRLIRPDVHVSDDLEQHLVLGERSPDAIALAEPILIKRTPAPERHIEIVGRDGRVITAIEFISPWNKVGANSRAQYHRKQAAYLDAGINLVEVELVRRGRYVLAAPLIEYEDLRTPYLICVFRQTEPDQFEVYRAPLQNVLPNVPVPLRAEERDAILQLQPLVDACYRDGRYHRIDYQTDPNPPFEPDLAEWLDSRLKNVGRRKG